MVTSGYNEVLAAVFCPDDGAAVAASADLHRGQNFQVSPVVGADS